MKKILIGMIVLTVTVSLINAKEDQDSSSKNDKVAFQKNKKATDQNSPKEIYNLGVRYSNGKNIKKDIKMAYKLFLKSANMGYAKAQYNMGVLYLNGISVKKDDQEAFKWFEMASKQNFPAALYVMGLLYEKGRGVKEDIKNALGHYVSAAGLGEKRALKRIETEPLLKKDLELEKMGLTAIKEGDHQSAIGYFQKSLLIREEVLEEVSINTANTYRYLAYCYKKIRDYSKALEYRQKSLTIRKKLLGIGHTDIATGFNNIGLLYHSMGDYSKALEYFQKSLAILEKMPENDRPDTTIIYRNVASAYQSMGDYPKALEYYQKSLNLLERYPGKEDIRLAVNYSKIGIIYTQMGDYTNALTYHLKALYLLENIQSEADKNTASSYAHVSRAYMDIGDYSNAMDFAKKTLAIRRKFSGENHTDTASSYNTLGELYRVTGDYPNALKNFHKSLSIDENIYGNENIRLAATYNNLGVLYENIGDYPNALIYSKKSIAIIKNVLGEEHIDMAQNYSNISILYNVMGNAPKALEYEKKALAIRINILGTNHPHLARSYISLAGFYETMKDYPKALEYHKKALDIREKLLGKEHPDTANNYRFLSGFYLKLGDDNKALEYVQKALIIDKNSFSADSVHMADSFFIMGAIYHARKNYSKAVEYYKKALTIREKALEEEHISISIIYFSLAAIYENLEDYSKAIEYVQKTLAINKKIFGENHYTTASSYFALGSLAKTKGDYSKSLGYYQKAISIQEQIQGKGALGVEYGALGSLYLEMNNHPKSYHYAKLAFTTFLKNRDQAFIILDSEQKEKYLKSTSKFISLLLESSYTYVQELNVKGEKNKAQQILQSGANDWLNYKGSIFDSENAIAMLFANTKDPELKVKIDELVSSKRYLATRYQSFPKPKEREEWQNQIKTTEAKISQLTNEISSKAASFKEQQGLHSIVYKDITKHLKEDELYIDYAKIAENYYLFSLDSKENIIFIQINSKNTKKIDILVDTFREDVNTILNESTLSDEKLKVLTESSKTKLSKLYELVLKEPLGDKLKNKKSLIISPDGALRLLPFEALFDKEKNQYFIEEKEIRYIPSGKELVRLYKYSKDKVAKVKQNAVIFANPNFNTKIASVSKDQMAITPNTNRSGIIKSLFRMRFDPLPGTEAEAKAIKGTLNQKSILEYQTNKATESTLMKVKEPKILHIATHGFFINDNTIPNPMLKSGIALAGANASAIKGKSDGIVTALKLSGLDLKGTDLVVLSACQTGVVDINATDSVSGLSKAFIQAGAKDIVMSLWSVDDQATKDLMTSFYQEMKENKNYAKALKAAKLKMIEEGRHPFYWGAFVVSGL